MGDALRKTENQISSLSGEVRAINKQLQFDPTNTVLLTQRTQALGEQVSSVSEKLKVLKDNQEQVNKGYDAQGNAIAKSDVRAYNREIETMENILNSLQQSQDKANRELEEGAAQFTKISEKSSTFADVLKANLTSEAIIGAMKAIGSAIKDIGISLVETAATVRAETAQFEQTFGSLGNEASAAISRVANASGILDTRLKSTGTAIYAFARSSGAETSQAMTLMEKALQAAADGAAYYDRSLENVSESLMSFLKGNYSNDAALGVSATEFTRNAKAVELFGNEFKNLSEIQKQQTLLQMVLDAQELSGAMGQAAREADGLENVRGNLEEIKRQLTAILGEPILDVLIPIMQEITARLEKMKPQIEAFARGLGDALRFLLDNGAAVILTIGGITAGVTLLGNATKTAAIAQAFTAMINPISLVSLAIGGTVIALTQLNKSMEESREKAVRTGEALQGFVAEIEDARDQSSNFSNLVNEFDELKKSIESNTLSAVELQAAEAELAAKGEQLIKASGGLITSYEIENGVSQTKIDLLQQELDLKEQIAIQNAKEYMAENSYEDLENAANKAQEEIDKLVQKQAEQENAVKRLTELQAEYNLRLKDTSQDIRTYENDAERMADLQAEYSAKMREYANVLGITVDTYDSIEGVVQRSIDSWKATGDALNDANSILITANKNLIIYKENEELANSERTEALKASLGIIEANKKYTESTDRLIEASAEQRDGNDKLVSSIKKADQELIKLDNAYQKIQSGSKLTNKEINELSKAFPELSQYIEENGEASIYNSDIIKELSGKTREERKKNIDAANAEQESTITTMKAQAAQSAVSYKAIITNISSVAQARKAIAGIETGVMGPLMSNEMKLNKELAESEKTLEKLRELSEAIVTGGSASASGGSKGSGGKSAAEKAADEADKLRKEALDADLATYNHRVKMGELSKNEQIKQLEEIRDKHILTLEEERKFKEDIYSIETEMTKDAEDKKKKLIDGTSKAMKEQYQEDLKDAKDNYEDKVKALKNAKTQEKSLIESTRTTQKGAYSDELYEIQGITDTKIKYYKEAEIAQIEASDKATAAILKNINAETDALLEQLKIKNAPLYAEIMEGRDRKQTIRDELDEEAKRRKEIQQQERIAELELNYLKAENDEDRAERLKALEDYKAEIEYAKWQEAENAKIKALEDREKELIKQINENNAETAEKANDMRESTLEKNIAQLEQDFELLESKYNGLIEGAIAEATEIAESEAYKMGELTVDGITEAIQDKGPDAVKAMKELAQQIADAYNETLDIHSPSRLMRKQTHFVGDGIILGIKDMLSSIRAAAMAIPDSISSAITSGTSNTMADEMYRLGQASGQRFTTGMEDAAEIIGRAANRLGISSSASASNESASALSAAGAGGVNITIEIGSFVNNTDEDIESLGNSLGDTISERLAFREKQILTGRGKKY